MSSYFKELKANPDKWLNMAFGLIGLPSTFMLVISSYNQGDEVGYLQLSIMLFFIFTILVFLWSKRPIGKKRSFDIGNTFSPFFRKEDTVLWVRVQQRNALLEKIKNIEKKEKKIIVMTGTSGSGKSTLIKDIKDNELLGSEYSCDYINSYKSLKNIVFKGGNKVVILDEFDAFFEELLTNRLSDDDIGKMDGLKKEIIKIFDSGAVVVIVIRDDKYHLLKLFGEMIPALSDSVILEKVSFNNKQDYDDVFGVVLEKIRKIIISGCKKRKKTYSRNYSIDDADRVCEEIPFFCYEVSLFELHCFCALMSYYDINGKDFSSVIDMSPNYVIRELIRECVDSYDDPVLCMRVMYAILQRMRMKEKIAASSIVDIIDVIDIASDQDHKSIADVLNFLHQNGLIKCCDKRYLLSHKALEYPVDLLVIDFLTTMESDNIRYLVESKKNKCRASCTFKWEDRIYYGVALTLILMVSINLLNITAWGFDTNKFWYNDSAVKYNLNYKYFPIALPHLLWCNYVLLHYKKVYKYFDVTNMQKAISATIVLNLIICILVGILWPQFWILSIGWGGLIQNIKTHLYSLDRRLSVITRESFSGRSNQTYVNMGATFIIGILFASLTNADLFGIDNYILFLKTLKYGFDKDYLTFVYYLFSGLYIYAYIALYIDHISERQSIIMRSQLQRGVT